MAGRLSKRSDENRASGDKNAFMDAKEAGEYFGVSASAMRVLAKQKRIPAVRIGSVWRFRRSVIENWNGTGVESSEHGATVQAAKAS